MNVGDSIRQLREAHNMTQEELGKVAGVSAMAVSQWENGRAVPRMGSIQRVADHFGIPKSTIMGDRSEYAFIKLENTAEEVELVNCYRSMSPRFKALLLENARAYADSGRAKNNQVSDAV